MKYLSTISSGLALGVVIALLVFSSPTSSRFGAFSDTFLSIQLASSPSNGRILQTDGTDNTWITCATLTGSADLCDGSDDGGGGSGGTPFAWDTTDYGVSTTTILGFNNGFLSNASSTINANLLINGNATSTNFAVTSLTSALISAAADGSFSEYAGTSCTNQFIRSLSALGIATCATVANTDLANSTVSYGGIQLSLGGSDATPAFALADATGLPISTGVSGLGTGIATWLGTPSIANFFSALTGEGSGVETFLTTPSSANFLSLLSDNLDLGSETSFEIPNNGTVNANGEITTDDTTGQFRYYAGSAERVLTPDFDKSLYVASSTADKLFVGFATATSTFELWNPSRASTLTKFYCKTDTGTLLVRLGDGTNWTTHAICSSSGVEASSLSNNTFTAREDVQVQIGTQSSNPNKVTITGTFTPTAD